MKEHVWEKEAEIVKAPTNIAFYFWKCKECGASGGPVRLKTAKPEGSLFLAGAGLVDLPDDCGEAKKLIAEYWEKYPASEPFIRAIMIARSS